MPFLPISNLPNGKPSVKIFFNGLIILRSPDGQTCFVETHRAPLYPHTLSVEVRTKVPGRPDVILLRHFGHLPGPDPGLSIRVESIAANPPAPVPSAMYKYVPSASFDPIHPTGNEQDEDFRWVVNLEASHFHGQPLTVDTTKSRPGGVMGGVIDGVIDSGVYYFYTAQLKKEQIEVVQGHTPKSPLASIATLIGAYLYLDDETEAVVTCRASGGDHVLRLERPDVAAGVSHEIYIDNSPLFEDPVQGGSHSELVEYYRVITGVPKDKRFNLTFPGVAPLAAGAALKGSAKFNLFGSVRIPCMSITLDGP
ncbi:MAG: hypothetical protein QOE33_2348 [Acidobacteriota bacterium]|nr:hypothetical protein [Acidobacteriota bacterium]